MLLLRRCWTHVSQPLVGCALYSVALYSQAECPSLRVQGGGQKCYVRDMSGCDGIYHINTHLRVCCFRLVVDSVILLELVPMAPWAPGSLLALPLRPLHLRPARLPLAVD